MENQQGLFEKPLPYRFIPGNRVVHSNSKFLGHHGERDSGWFISRRLTHPQHLSKLLFFPEIFDTEEQHGVFLYPFCCHCICFLLRAATVGQSHQGHTSLEASPSMVLKAAGMLAVPFPGLCSSDSLCAWPGLKEASPGHQAPTSFEAPLRYLPEC